LANGVYNATLVFQATNAIPQVIEVPVVFTAGPTSSAMSIGGVTDGASFQQAAAPGMIRSVFGAGIAPCPQAAGSLPLPQSMAGVSANGQRNSRAFALRLVRTIEYSDTVSGWRRRGGSGSERTVGVVYFHSITDCARYFRGCVTRFGSHFQRKAR